LTRISILIWVKIDATLSQFVYQSLRNTFNGDEIMDFLTALFGSPVPTLTAVELNEKLKSGKPPFVLDVRQPEEFREGHISGAKLIPLGELHQHMKELPREREVVCVCASGNRSSSATRQLASVGFNVINMKGGMSAWQRVALPVKKGITS
jgi:rhodanese-related sulfurtransferase